MQREGGRADVNGGAKNAINEARPDTDEGFRRLRFKNGYGDRLMAVVQRAMQSG